MPKHLNIRNLKSHQGFTLIEMLVALTAFLMMIGGIMYNYKINKKSILDSASEEVIASFKEIQQKSLGHDFSGIDPAINCFEGCIFGVNFDNSEGTEYRIFADLSIPADYCYNVGDLILETKELPKGLEYSITDLAVANIAYKSPYGEAHITDSACAPIDCSGSNNCNLEMSSRDNEIINIKINDQGLVYAE